MMEQTKEANDWQTVDHALRGIARRRAALDVEEARWLREAERLEIWKPLGMVGALDYCDRVLGYTPHAAKERLRVARALGELPLIEQAFAAGRLTFSSVRELTRVATAMSEHDWLDEVRGKSHREIEQAVAGLKHGDGPKSLRDPKARMHRLLLEVRADVFARLREIRTLLGSECGHHLDDSDLLAMLCDAAFDRTANTNEPSGRAKFQIALSLCPRCEHASQEARGELIPIDAAALSRARCDAQYIGSLDGDSPERATQDIPPSVVRFVWRRDRGRCQAPGCRSTIGIEIHHLCWRSEGGGHDPLNLCLLCSSCHLALHRGALALARSRDGTLSAARPNEPRDQCAELPSQARDALVALGWAPAIARGAVHEASSHLGSDTTIESLIREALRRCPKPTDRRQSAS
jgi:hypothetical protein